KLQQREQASGKIKIDHLAKTLPATYIVFDVLYVGDESVMGLSQMERKAILPDLVEVDDKVVLSDYIEGRGIDYYNAVIARVLEGPSHARAVVLPRARRQAARGVRRHVLVSFRLLYALRMRLGPRRGTPMAKLELTDVEIYVKDLKAARAFYTKKIGLKVRSSMPKWGYLALGATKGGEDAALTPWQPVPEWGKEMYESRLKMIGGVTGIGFITNDLKRT